MEYGGCVRGCCGSRRSPPYSFPGCLGDSLWRNIVRKSLRLTLRQKRVLQQVDALGWASGPLLAFLNGADYGQRDYYLEEYLPRLVERGLLWSKRWGRQRIYRLPAYGTGRNPNIEHSLLAGQVAVRLLRSSGATAEALVPRRVLADAGMRVIADAAVMLAAANGRHLFLVEYQSPRESERTTSDKIKEYKLDAALLQQQLAVAGVWIVFILDVLRLRAEEIAQSQQDGWPTFYFCDRETFMTTDWRCVLQEPIFYWSGAAGTHALVRKD